MQTINSSFAVQRLLQTRPDRRSQARKPLAFQRVLLALGTPLLFVLAEAAWGQAWTPISGMSTHLYDIKGLEDSDTLIVATEGRPYWSGDNGQTWDTLSPGRRVEFRYFVLFRHDGRQEIVYLSVAEPHIRRTTDLGQSWVAATDQVLDLEGGNLKMDRWGRIWIYYDNVYSSSDWGAHWDSLAIPDSLNVIMDVWVSEQDSNLIWVADWADGVFVSGDHGDTWSRAYEATQVLHVRGNPENGHSVVIVRSGQSLLWNHGDGVWSELLTPVVGGRMDFTFLSGDSTQMLAVAGAGHVEGSSRNIYRSTDGGTTWHVELGGVYSAYASRIVNVDLAGSRVAALLEGGALLGDGDWNNIRRINLHLGVTFHVFVVSRHLPGLIYGTAYEGVYVSADGGRHWTETPYAGFSYALAEHPSRPAMYVRVGYWEGLRLVSYPDLQVDTLTVPPVIAVFMVFPSQADTARLYLTDSYSFYASTDRGHTWVQRTYPADPGEVCWLIPSSSDPDAAFLSSTNGQVMPAYVWRTTDAGTTWDCVFAAPVSTRYLVINDCWACGDALTDLNLSAVELVSGDNWYYYSTDRGATFDSLMTRPYQQSGYYFDGWGDSTMVFTDELDSVFVTPDHGDTLQFRLVPPIEPDVGNNYYVGGAFSQLILAGGATCYYYSPTNSSAPGPNRDLIPDKVTMLVYPNPTNSSPYVQLSLQLGMDPVRIRIYNVLGQQVLSLPDVTGTRASFPLPIGSLSSGFYWVVVQDRHQRIVAQSKVLLLK